MKYLTRKEVISLAPGATPRRNAAKERLLCTDIWLTLAEQNGFKPVFALQGTSHEDAGTDPKDGRHLIVAANDRGHAISLLNSHDKLQRTWGGIGLWGGDLLLADVAPLQRWKWQMPLLHNPDLERIHQQMSNLCRKTEGPILAAEISKYGYIGGRGRPHPADLWVKASEGLGVSDTLHTACAIVAACRRGNLAPSTHAKTRRRIKGIRRPDALQYLALAAYAAAMKVADK